MDGTQRTDETLVACAQRGDKQAEEELLLRYRNLVRYCARKFFLVGGETEDLIQEGMMGLFQAVSAYRCEDGGASFKTFAYLCVWRRIVDAVKAAAKKEPLGKIVLLPDVDFVHTAPDPDAELISVDEQKELTQKISWVLSDMEFRVFTLYVGGMSCAEICEATGKTAKSVDNALQRSKAKLQKMLGK